MRKERAEFVKLTEAQQQTHAARSAFGVSGGSGSGIGTDWRGWTRVRGGSSSGGSNGCGLKSLIWIILS